LKKKGSAVSGCVERRESCGKWLRALEPPFFRNSDYVRSPRTGSAGPPIFESRFPQRIRVNLESLPNPSGDIGAPEKLIIPIGLEVSFYIVGTQRIRRREHNFTVHLFDQPAMLHETAGQITSIAQDGRGTDVKDCGDSFIPPELISSVSFGQLFSAATVTTLVAALLKRGGDRDESGLRKSGHPSKASGSHRDGSRPRPGSLSFGNARTIAQFLFISSETSQ
jgi:hypothetical protein